MGSTLVVGASYEDSNGGQSNNAATDSRRGLHLLGDRWQAWRAHCALTKPSTNS